ncbi:hypothetical protein [Apocheima cinerarium nucleopolyhedrovirus]|uniref:hypothetical protein n=1 Tax=Apocheima cinerarium nucleopolyhedrovirus TaxID=307461 RepID=UPI0001D92093|nr:hypothetical protein [Apocheima cinerarium nucleopolyhedrovirus]ADB84421.1 hypothetical protein [Apocheima cinerarium nucleopolyhedrovirus]
MAAEKTIYLYLSDLPADMQNDKRADDDVLYFESVIECFEDDSCDKYSVFATLKKEQALFMKKTFYDLLEHNNGTYCKNHVLIDALLMYKTYVELVDESAFGNDILESCVDFLTNIFKLFRLQSKIIVVASQNINNYNHDNLSELLKHLLQLSIIEIV